MALWICTDCGTAYSVDAPACPHCGSTGYAEEGTDEAMAKISRYGGPSDNTVPTEESDMGEPEETTEAAAEATEEPAEETAAEPEATAESAEVAGEAAAEEVATEG